MALLRDVQPDAAPVSSSARRSTSPCCSSFVTAFEIAAGDIRSCVASPRTPIPGRVLDRDEQRDLAAGHADRVDLAAELPGEPQQGRAQPVRDLDFVNLGNVHLVNYIGRA